MDSQGLGPDIKFLVTTLRRVTTAAQVLPFIYSSLYITVLVLYSITPENVAMVLDSVFYVSPVFVLSFLLLSKVLKLCRWHKTACVMPLIPSAVSLVDYYIIELTEVEAFVFNGVVILMAILLLIAAYNVFMK